MNDVLDVCTLQQSAWFMLRERIQTRNPLNLCQSHKLGLSFACRTDFNRRAILSTGTETRHSCVPETVLSLCCFLLSHC